MASIKRNKIQINARFPFDPSKWPFFYGWVVWVAGTLGIICSTPGQTIGVSVFTEHLMETFGIDRNQLTFAYMVGTIGSSFLLTKMGKMYDKMGARVIIIFASFMLGFMLVFLTLIDNIAGLLKTKFGIISLWPVMVMIIIGFFGIRLFGQGILTMISRNMVMKWFVQRRGLANMFMGAFVALGFSATPKVFNQLIGQYGWQMTWVFIALIIGTGFTVIVLFFFRDNPQDAGLKPDGNLISVKNKKQMLPAIQDYTVKQARKTYNFWFFCTALCLNGFYFTAYYFHIVSIFKEPGLGEDVAVSIFVPSAIVAVCISLAGSYISDFIKLKNLMIINALGIAISCLATIYLEHSLVFVTWIIIGNGMLNGTFSVISALVWPRFFGTKYLGEVSGFALSFMVFSSAIAPIFFSLSQYVYNSYHPALWLSLIISILLLLFSFKATNENEKALKL
jgi:MFS transporter, OFA family, oxalate/formate antiporter